MKRIWIILTVLAFLGGCTASLGPLWDMAEKRYTRNIDSEIPHHFPILAQGTKGNPAFRVVIWGDREEATPVTRIHPDQVDEINDSLSSTISSTPGPHRYFQIVDRTASHLDVCVEIPTVKDSHVQGWYRIQNDIIIPQKILAYGPGFAFALIPFSVLAGAACAGAFYAITTRFRKKLAKQDFS